jgi:hypothetical protein
MKKTILFTIIIFAGFTVNLSAQGDDVTTGASADLLVAMTLTENSSLSFGYSLLTSSAGGTVVLPSNSITRTYTGGVATSAATPAPTNASYSVTGTGLETYAVTLPLTTTVTHTTVGVGVITMDITLMKARFDGEGADATTSTLATDGTDSFTLGGSLTVKEDQIGGQYTGTFPVSVDYN